MNLVLLKEIGQPFIFEEPSNENLKNFITKFINDFKE
jgi:3-dehydroquinate synthetase